MALFEYHSDLKKVLLITGTVCAGLIVMEILWGLYLINIFLQLMTLLFWVSVWVLVLTNFLEIFRLWPGKKYLAFLPGCYAMHAYTDENNELTVRFFLGGGFPNKHSGVLYTDGEPPNLAVRRINGSEFSTGCFYFWHD